MLPAEASASGFTFRAGTVLVLLAVDPVADTGFARIAESEVLDFEEVALGVGPDTHAPYHAEAHGDHRSTGESAGVPLPRALRAASSRDGHATRAERAQLFDRDGNDGAPLDGAAARRRSCCGVDAGTARSPLLRSATGTSTSTWSAWMPADAWRWTTIPARRRTTCRIISRRAADHAGRPVSEHLVVPRAGSLS
jgi:hypothetical protein